MTISIFGPYCIVHDITELGVKVAVGEIRGASEEAVKNAIVLTILKMRVSENLPLDRLEHFMTVNDEFTKIHLSELLVADVEKSRELYVKAMEELS
jgi:hypothetical protein